MHWKKTSTTRQTIQHRLITKSSYFQRQNTPPRKAIQKRERVTQDIFFDGVNIHQYTNRNKINSNHLPQTLNMKKTTT
jgi:DNA-binding transcriptional regulator YbjK